MDTPRRRSPATLNVENLCLVWWLEILGVRIMSSESLGHSGRFDLGWRESLGVGLHECDSRNDQLLGFILIDCRRILEGLPFCFKPSAATPPRPPPSAATRSRSFEKHRLSAAANPSAASVWPFFSLLESLNLGPLPISARPMSQIPAVSSDDDEAFSKSQSINYILQRPTIVNRFAPERKFNAPTEAIGGNESSFLSKLAAEIRAFSERFVGMENMKMELMKETERARMEMENKRTEIILQSQ